MRSLCLLLGLPLLDVFGVLLGLPLRRLGTSERRDRTDPSSSEGSGGESFRALFEGWSGVGISSMRFRFEDVMGERGGVGISHSPTTPHVFSSQSSILCDFGDIDVRLDGVEVNLYQLAMR